MATPMAMIPASKNVPPEEEDLGRKREFDESLMMSNFSQERIRPENLRIKIESVPENLLSAIQEIAQDYHDVIFMHEDNEKQDDIIYWRLTFRGPHLDGMGVLDQGETFLRIDEGDPLETLHKFKSTKISIYHYGIIEGN